MQPESSSKRNIFRASLRREFIESYQHSIRMKYLLLEREQSSFQFHDRLKLSSQNFVPRLEEILKLPSQEICKIDHFDYFVSCVETLAKKSNGGSDVGWKLKMRQHSQMYTSQTKPPELIYEETRFSNIKSSSQQRKSSKISGVWVHKQRVYSLLYRILDKAFSEQKGKLWYVIDRALYLLEFPELMPLWQKLAGVVDEKPKNYCCKQFAKKLLRSPSCTSNPQSCIILDPDFVLDILTNFIVQAPCVSFDNMMELMPFISYSLRIQEQKTHQCESSESNYPILNKVCIIMRSILKSDSKERLIRMVDYGYGDIFVHLIQHTFKLLGYEGGENFENSEPSPGKNIGYSLECGFAQLSWYRKPANLQIMAKTNLIKLLNRLFVSCPQIATFLFLKIRNPYFLHSLFFQFLNPHSMCTAQFTQQRVGDKFPQKYQSIILCDSHRTLLKTILATVHTMLVTGSTVGYSFISDFLRCDGISFLERCVQMEKAENRFGKEIVSLMSGLDLEGEQFYGKLNEEEFSKFMRTQIELLCCCGMGYIEQRGKLAYSISTVSINEFIELRGCLLKQLKLTRNSLLIAYARATSPAIFQCSREYVLDISECREVLEEVGRMEDSKSEEQQIKIYSHHILSFCSHPLAYIQQHNTSTRSLTGDCLSNFESTA